MTGKGEGVRSLTTKKQREDVEERLKSIRWAMWMCFGNLMHHAVRSDLSLVPGTFTEPQTYCEVQRESCFGWNYEFELGNGLFTLW